ncbi:thioesterase family protein [Pseudoalteromonas sp. PB2-1]|uniref:thioesterase family protein n=1 Tax=Pseudoalteromonas sp. PB2-1 TaxID=2907242 RepID=UPI00370377BE
MHFEQLLAKASELGCDRTKVMQFPENWCQGRTAFGGLSAALLYQAMRQHINSSRRLLSLSTNFVGPLIADTDFSIDVEVLREGKNSAQVLARIIQDGDVCIITQACFGAKRQSTVRVDVTKTMQLKPVDERFALPYKEGEMPAFFQHIALCLQDGNMPFSAADTSHLSGWMKLKHTPEQMNEAQIIALADAWPPTLLQMYKQPAPASSMSWYLEFVEEPNIAHDAWVGYEAITHHSKNGYGLEDGCIWSEDGKLIALSRQTVALFA